LFSTDSTAREAPLARLTEAFRDTSLAIGATRKFRAAVLFDNIGPYHRARLEALADTCELLAVELGRTSHDYSWSAVESQRFGRVTINPLGESSKLAGAVLRERLGRSLRQFKPDVVFVPGWSCRGAIFAIHWCVRNRKRVVVMSESTRLEARRTPASEFIKERLLALAAASLAGGTPQKDYLINLGMKPERVALGYDAVDNRHFEAGAESVRRSESDEFEQPVENPTAASTAPPLLSRLGTVHRKEEPSKTDRGLCSLQKPGTKQRPSVGAQGLGSRFARRWAASSRIASSTQFSRLV
jgi:hypothetical protein